MNANQMKMFVRRSGLVAAAVVALACPALAADGAGILSPAINLTNLDRTGIVQVWTVVG